MKDQSNMAGEGSVVLNDYVISKFTANFVSYFLLVPDKVMNYISLRVTIERTRNMLLMTHDAYRKNTTCDLVLQRL